MPFLSLPARYEPLAPLGKGGGGEVWAVRDRITDRKVAFKVLAEGADEREGMALVREAVALSGVEGLGVPRVLRFGRLAGTGRSYMVRELVEGESLADAMARPEQEPRVLLDAVAQAADQLTRLHRALLLHGDIKPANIIVDGEGRASLVDLGLATAWTEGARPEGLTPRYAAPELFRGAPLGVRVEVFALGATLDHVLELCGARLAPEVAAALGGVVRRATLEEPSERYPSADELASALRRAAGLPEPSRRHGVAWPIVGIDGLSATLLSEIGALPPGGVLLVTGPRLSGRSALLRRAAWSLGVEGRAVAWIEARAAASIEQAVTIELEGLGDEGVILVDDAAALRPEATQTLAKEQKKGCRIVLVADVLPAGFAPPSRTLPMAPLATMDAEGLVRRAIPSLSDAVVTHVILRAQGWPGRLRNIVSRLERVPVVTAADVDRLLADEVAPVSHRGERVEIQDLLDRGRFDEAAQRLAPFAGDASPELAIARARLATNRGEPQRALAELGVVSDDVLAGLDRELAATWFLCAARAHLRAGHHAEAEEAAERAIARLVGTATHRLDRAATRTLVSGAFDAKLPEGPISTRAVLVESFTALGLAESYVSRHAEAKATLTRAVQIARGLGQPRILAQALTSLAFALQRNDELAGAALAYEEALRAAEEAGDAGLLATIRLNLASMAKMRGDLASALTHFEAAVDMGQRSGRHATLRQALLNLANTDLYLGRLARARVSIDTLVAQRAELSSQQQGQLLALEAEYAARSGDPTTAELRCAECAAAYEAVGMLVDAAEARLERVLIAAPQPSPDLALLGRELERAEECLGDGTAHRALLGLARGRLLARRGEEEGARAAYEQALAAAREAGQRDLVWRALDARGALESAAGQPLRARRDREAALAVLEEIAERLPRDLREVYWNDPRRRSLRQSILHEVASGPTIGMPLPTEDRLARVLEINREILGEHDLPRLLARVTDHAVALLRAERGFVILQAGYAIEPGSAVPLVSEPLPGSAPPLTSPSASAGGETIASVPSLSGGPAELDLRVPRPGRRRPHARFSRSIAERVIAQGSPSSPSSAGRTRAWPTTSRSTSSCCRVGRLRAHPRAPRLGDRRPLPRDAPAPHGVASRGELPTLLALRRSGGHRHRDRASRRRERAPRAGARPRQRGARSGARQARGAARPPHGAARADAPRSAQHPRRDARPFRLRGPRRHQRGDASRLRAHRPHQGHRRPRPHRRRERHRQGGRRPRDPQRRRPRARRRSSASTAAPSPSTSWRASSSVTCAARSPGPTAIARASSARPPTAPSCSTRSARCPRRCRLGLLRVFQEKVVRPVGARGRSRSTRASSPRRTATSPRWSRKAFREDLYYRLNVILGPRPAAARAPGGHPRPHRSLPRHLRRALQPRAPQRLARRAEAPHGLPLARQRAPARERAAQRVGAERQARARDRRLRAPRREPRILAPERPRTARRLEGARVRRPSLDAHKRRARAHPRRAGRRNWNRVKAAQLCRHAAPHVLPPPQGVRHPVALRAASGLPGVSPERAAAVWCEPCASVSPPLLLWASSVSSPLHSPAPRA
jgi:serine/threonine-protein kinase PknK